jgi:hypothetical protein
MTKAEERDLAHVLVELGTAVYHIQKKNCELARKKLDEATHRLRRMLKVEGDDEKSSE